MSSPEGSAKSILKLAAVAGIGGFAPEGLGLFTAAKGAEMLMDAGGTTGGGRTPNVLARALRLLPPHAAPIPTSSQLTNAIEAGRGPSPPPSRAARSR
jgi:hypothetical protein